MHLFNKFFAEGAPLSGSETIYALEPTAQVAHETKRKAGLKKRGSAIDNGDAEKPPNRKSVGEAQPPEQARPIKAKGRDGKAGRRGTLIDYNERDDLAAAISCNDVPVDVFNQIQRRCFFDAMLRIFEPWKLTDEYPRIKALIAEVQNKVTPDDFDFMEWLGRGTYGVVIHARKRSTGVHYALKVSGRRSMLSRSHAMFMAFAPPFVRYNRSGR